MCCTTELSRAARVTPNAQETFVWRALSELCVAVATCCLHPSAKSSVTASWHPLGSTSEPVSGCTDSPDTTDYHISKSEAWFPISKLNPAKCSTGFLQLFSRRQRYFHSPQAAVYVNPCKRIAKGWHNLPAGGCGVRKACFASWTENLPLLLS